MTHNPSVFRKNLKNPTSHAALSFLILDLSVFYMGGTHAPIMFLFRFCCIYLKDKKKDPVVFTYKAHYYVPSTKKLDDVGIK